jgi:hypothetical protein
MYDIRCTFKFKCPKTWNELAVTEDNAVRFCTHCESNVHWVDDEAQLLVFAKEGACVAFNAPASTGASKSSSRLMVGRPYGETTYVTGGSTERE